MSLPGPLVSNQDGRYLLLGITSFGEGCDSIAQLSLWNNNKDDNKILNGVYTNVESYVDWIKDNSDYTECSLSKGPFQ